MKVLDWIKEHLSVEECEEVVKHGCASGIVSELIYYHDTVKFHDDYENDIWEMLEEEAKTMDQTILELIASFNGCKHVGSMYQFKNLLCLYAVERVCGEISNV